MIVLGRFRLLGDLEDEVKEGRPAYDEGKQCLEIAGRGLAKFCTK
jgi:hypothetical protein